MKKIILFLLAISITCVGTVRNPVYYMKYDDGIALIHQDGSFDYGIDTFGKISYNDNGTVNNASGKKISYNEDGTVKQIGRSKISYYADGRLKQAGSSTINYDKEGRVTRIGSSRVTYNADGTVKNVNHGLAGIKKSFEPILSFEIKGKVVIYINKASEIAFGVVTGGKVSFNKDGRIKSVGSAKVFYNKDDKVKSISGTTIFYDKNGKVKSIGGKSFSINKEGQLNYIGSAKITYNKEGKIIRTGNGVIAIFKNLREIKPKDKKEEIPSLPFSRKSQDKNKEGIKNKKEIKK